MQLELDEDKFTECVTAIRTQLVLMKADQLSGAIIMLPFLAQSIEDIEKAAPDRPLVYTIMLEKLATDLANLAQHYPELIFWKKNNA